MCVLLNNIPYYILYIASIKLYVKFIQASFSQVRLAGYTQLPAEILKTYVNAHPRESSCVQGPNVMAKAVTIIQW